MKKTFINTLSGITVCVLLLLQTSVHAQASRVWVSGYGDDANPCSRTAPCKSFDTAIQRVAPGGEISVLDPGDYGGYSYADPPSTDVNGDPIPFNAANFGPITINKSVTISGDGTLAGIVWAPDAIIINAAATDVVTIRNISLLIATPTDANSGPSTPPVTGSAIKYISAGRVNIENCKIVNAPTAGIQVNVSAAATLMVKNTSITSSVDNAVGIDLNSSNGALAVNLDNVQITSSTGINASNNVVATISKSVIGQGTTAIQAQNNSVVNLENTVVSNNTTGINCNSAAATVRLSRVSLLNNNTGITGTGKVISFNNNILAGNSTNSTLPLSTLKMQ